ncbi:MAG: tetratricopeptide repeat protein [Gemmataceae bacterium]|nr:tetratricopeptide repeat protein [Gemmataceae bacterium]MDW8265817.1 tetratricopeptide repeat protein [Gemmataceae bacterium]
MRVTLSMIVKDEEDHLPASLSAVADLVDEIVIVDTGSTDRSREIAQRFGARVYDFPWCDHFSAARNETLRHATGDWIFWMGADDRIDEVNRNKLRTLFRGLQDELAVYMMKCWCPPDAANPAPVLLDHARLFRRHPAVRWKYRVHEQVAASVVALGGRVYPTDIVIVHAGYQAVAEQEAKMERNLRLLLQDVEEYPEDLDVLYYLAVTCQCLRRPAESVRHCCRGIALGRYQELRTRQLYILLTLGHYQLGQRAEALAAAAEGLRHYPDDDELLFQYAVVLRELGRPTEAEAVFWHLLRTPPAGPPLFGNEGLRGYRARHELAQLYLQQHRDAEAEALWRATLQEQPHYVPAWQGLGELSIKLGRFDVLEAIVQRLESSGMGRVEAALLRALAHLTRGELTAAEALLVPLLAAVPQAVKPRLVLARLRLRQGQYDQAEQLLREVLALDPSQPEALAEWSGLRRPAVPGTMTATEPLGSQA